MSIRTCAWPDCPSRFPTAQGPSTGGWKVFASPAAKILLCPFHSEMDHGPTVVRLTPQYNGPARFSCTCGDWSGPLVDSMIVGLREWQGHVRVLKETEQGA
jgi:hypothetical protein